MISLILPVYSKFQPPQSSGVLNRIGLRLIKDRHCYSHQFTGSAAGLRGIPLEDPLLLTFQSFSVPEGADAFLINYVYGAESLSDHNSNRIVIRLYDSDKKILFEDVFYYSATQRWGSGNLASRIRCVSSHTVIVELNSEEFRKTASLEITCFAGDYLANFDNLSFGFMNL